MKNTDNSTKATKSRRAVTKLRVAGVKCNPAPDAQMRLRRIFTILIKHVERDGQKTPKKDSSDEVALSDDSTMENVK